METPHLPVISITFQQLAETIIARSARGTMFLVVKDTTQTGEQVQEVKSATFKSLKVNYTEENQKYIEDVLNVNPFKLFVVKMGEDTTIDQVWELVKKTYSSGRIVLADGTAEEYKELADLVKLQEAFHALTYNLEGTDCMYVENGRSAMYKESSYIQIPNTSLYHIVHTIVQTFSPNYCDK